MQYSDGRVHLILGQPLEQETEASSSLLSSKQTIVSRVSRVAGKVAKRTLSSFYDFYSKGVELGKAKSLSRGHKITHF